jgi:hypothetical protein
VNPETESCMTDSVHAQTKPKTTAKPSTRPESKVRKGVKVAVQPRNSLPGTWREVELGDGDGADSHRQEGCARQEQLGRKQDGGVAAAVATRDVQNKVRRRKIERVSLLDMT